MVTPRARVIVDNDFSGDPDDLFQLVHHVLSPAVEIPLIIGSKLPEGDPFDASDRQAENAVAVAAELLGMMGKAGDYRIEQGSNVSLSESAAPSAAAGAIVEEAMRDDTELPLYIALGAGMTELASAYRLEPRIAERLTAVWIGGNEHEGHAVPPAGAMPIEYNLSIDVPAAQVVFNDSGIPLWQVPRNVYRQCLVSQAELESRVRPMGAVGAALVEAIERVQRMAGEHGIHLGETYALGDSPLVLLTALQSAFEPDTSSSRHVEMPTPFLNADGTYTAHADGRTMRVYTQVDTRLMFEDFYLKLAAFAGLTRHAAHAGHAGQKDG